LGRDAGRTTSATKVRRVDGIDMERRRAMDIAAEQQDAPNP
jgi:hypothetical protein